jgi:alkyl hydroperoxide reductase subunit AhpF
VQLLSDEDAAYLKQEFAALTHDVTFTLVTAPSPSPSGDGAAEELRLICDELATTTPRLKLEHLDATAEPERARALVGERLPALVLSSPRTRGRLRYYGLPSGYEMSTLVAAVSDIGGDEPLQPDVLARLDALGGDTHIQVFVTPS